MRITRQLSHSFFERKNSGTARSNNDNNKEETSTFLRSFVFDDFADTERRDVKHQIVDMSKFNLRDSVPTFPALTWLKEYDWKTSLRSDLLAGCSVAVLLVPQSMAYAQLADLPPRYGLYSSIMPIIVYALTSDTTMTAVGPVAPTCIMIASALANIGAETDAEKIEIAGVMTLMVGIIFILFAVFQLGFVVKFLSRPVMTGFTTGAACVIGVSQLKALFKLDMEKTPLFYTTLVKAILALPSTHLPTLVLSFICCATLIGAKIYNLPRWIPLPLMLIVFSIIFSKVLDLESHGFELVGDIPSGLPSMVAPNFTWLGETSLWIASLILASILYLASIGLSTSFAIQRDQKIDSNQEIYAYALAHLAGSFFQSHPVSASFSRTAINFELGGVSQISSLIQAMFIIFCLLFLTGPLELLPKCVLSSIILASILGLIKISELKFLYHVNKPDAACFMTTWFGVLMLGIEPGIMVGVAVSMILLITRASSPQFVTFGRLPGTSKYVDVSRFQDVEILEDVHICQFRSELFYGNVDVFEGHILEVLHFPGIQAVVVDCSLIPYIDSSGIRAIDNCRTKAEELDIKFYLSSPKWPVRDSLEIGFKHLDAAAVKLFLSVDLALKYYMGLMEQPDEEENLERQRIERQRKEYEAGQEKMDRAQSFDLGHITSTTISTTLRSEKQEDFPMTPRSASETCEDLDRKTSHENLEMVKVKLKHQATL